MRWRAVVLFALSVALTACHPTREERNIVRRWLLCEECSQGELDSVVALGDRVIEPLGDALEGPRASGRENVRNQARAMFRRVTGPTLTEQQYVEHFVDNYVATYQSRAAVALSRIGTPRARALLVAAVQRDTAYRGDVVRTLGAAVHLSLSHQAGDSQSAPFDSVVLVNPAVVVRDSTTGQPLGNVRVAFLIDSGGGRVSDSVQRTDTNGVASVHWRLGPTDSINLLRVLAGGRVVRFHATGHGLAPRLVFTVQPSNVRRNHPFVPSVRLVVLDAWGRVDTPFNQNATVRVLGTSFIRVQPIVAGEAEMSGLVPSFIGTGLRLRVYAIGTAPAISEPFDVTP